VSKPIFVLQDAKYCQIFQCVSRIEMKFTPWNDSKNKTWISKHLKILTCPYAFIPLWLKSLGSSTHACMQERHRILC